MYHKFLSRTRRLSWDHGVLITLIVSITILLLLKLFPSTPTHKELTYSHRIRWNREKASTEMWQVTSVRPNKEAKSHMISWYRVTGFQQAHPELCENRGAGKLGVLVVTSAPGHRVQRQAVRLTWSSLARSGEFVVIFLLGQSPDHLKADLAAEDDVYGDLVTGNFVDSYMNLTLKSLSMLEWSHTYCPGAAFLLKVDDDVFINVPLLRQFMKQRVHERRTVWGRLIRLGPPIRDERSKFYVPVEEFAAERYPAYMEGPAYLISGDGVRVLLAAAKTARFLRMEDVLVAGALADGRLHRRNVPRFLYKCHLPASSWLPPPCHLQRHLAVHPLQPHQLHEAMWRNSLRCCRCWPR